MMVKGTKDGKTPKGNTTDSPPKYETYCPECGYVFKYIKRVHKPEYCECGKCFVDWITNSPDLWNCAGNIQKRAVKETGGVFESEAIEIAEKKAMGSTYHPSPKTEEKVYEITVRVRDDDERYGGTWRLDHEIVRDDFEFEIRNFMEKHAGLTMLSCKIREIKAFKLPEPDEDQEPFLVPGNCGTGIRWRK